MKFYLKMEITRDRLSRTYTLRQRDQIIQLGRKFHVSEDGETKRKAKIPLAPGFVFAIDEHLPILTDVEYREIIGSILYIARFTRPDILMAVNALSKYLDKPQKKHWNAAKGIVKYLVETQEYERTLGVKKGSQPMELVAYTDATCADDVENYSQDPVVYYASVAIQFTHIPNNKRQ